MCGFGAVNSNLFINNFEAGMAGNRTVGCEPLESFKSALPILEHADPTRQGYAECLNNLASIYLKLGLIPDARRHATISLDIRKGIYTSQRHPEIASSFNLLSVIENEVSNFELALEYCQKALDELAEDHHHVPYLMERQQRLQTKLQGLPV